VSTTQNLKKKSEKPGSLTKVGKKKKDTGGIDLTDFPPPESPESKKGALSDEFKEIESFIKNQAEQVKKSMASPEKGAADSDDSSSDDEQVFIKKISKNKKN
jgi:hypothetical protein